MRQRGGELFELLGDFRHNDSVKFRPANPSEHSPVPLVQVGRALVVRKVAEGASVAVDAVTTCEVDAWPGAKLCVPRAARAGTTVKSEVLLN